jgi:hypothetical protein
MALPASGQITLAEVNVELGYSSTAQIGLGDAAVRTLAGIPSGAISLDNLHGKANQFAFTISSNQTNANLATLATTAGWNGTSKVVATIGSGVYISSNSTGTAALTVASLPNGAEIINNGYIVGMGGAGGNGVTWNDSGISAGTVGGNGGLALSVSSTLSMTNNGTIAGGGGGGGGGQGARDPILSAGGTGGGGGGGGRSGTTNSAGGAAGGYGYRTITAPGAGQAGTSSAAGNGGTRGASRYYTTVYSGAGGTGGGWGASGVIGGSASGGAGGTPTAGGSAGGAVTGNSNITWVATGTRLGSIS